MRKPETQSDAVAKLSQSNGSNFFSSGLRQKVDQLMNMLYAGGVNNPMDSIEQLSYLIFLRLLSERDEQAALIEKSYQRIFSGEWARYAWGNFVTLTGNELFDTLRGAIEKLHELPNLSNTGRELFRNATLKIYDRPTLRAVVQTIAKASNYAEGLASVAAGIPAAGNTLGALCNQVGDWPHDQVKEALQKLYKFCSDYPGIRHAGNPAGVLRDLTTRDMTLASLLLLSFSGYLSPTLDEQVVLGV